MLAVGAFISVPIVRSHVPSIAMVSHTTRFEIIFVLV